MQHRTRKEYLRPADHQGPDSILLGGTVRVKRGETAKVHVTGAQHDQLLAEGWQVVLPVEPFSDTLPRPSEAPVTPRERESPPNGPDPEEANALLAMEQPGDPPSVVAEAEPPAEDTLGGTTNPRYDGPRRKGGREVTNG